MVMRKCIQFQVRRNPGVKCAVV